MNSQNVVGLTNSAGKPDEGEKIIFHKFRKIEDSPMPVPIYWEPRNPYANPVVPGLGRIWGCIDYAKVFGNEEYFDWKKIKEIWWENWRKNSKYTKNSVLLEKSPTSPTWAQMLSEQFENSYFIISIRNPYPVCEGIRRRIRQNQGYELSMESCVIHWIETAKLQISNIKNIRNSIWFTYEEMCDDAETVAAKINLLIPEISDIHVLFDQYISGKDYGGKIKNRNKESIRRLSKNDFEVINRYLSRNRHLLNFFNYS